MEHLDPLHIETPVKAKKRARARHRARGGQANAKAVDEAKTSSFVENDPAKIVNTSSRCGRARASSGENI